MRKTALETDKCPPHHWYIVDNYGTCKKCPATKEFKLWEGGSNSFNSSRLKGREVIRNKRRDKIEDAKKILDEYCEESRDTSKDPSLRDIERIRKAIYIRIDSSDKQALEFKTKQLGMTLTTYCRMVLLKSLEEK